MTTITTFAIGLATAAVFLLAGALNKDSEYNEFMLIVGGVLLSLNGLLLFPSPMVYQSGLVEVVTNSTTNTSFTYSQVSGSLNNSLALILSFVGVAAVWLGTELRKTKKQEALEDDGLGQFD